MKASRAQIEKDLGRSARRQYFSPAYFSQYHVTLPRIRQFTKGKTIDLGCGYMPFYDFISDQVTEYHGLDLHPRSDEVTLVADIQDMHMIENDSYDTAICLEVLEHTPDPFRAAGEIHRILRPGGVLIVSVPHLSRLHDEPDDYFRFTKYGLRDLLGREGFEVISLEHRGGLCSFIGHQMSTMLLGIAWSLPVIRQIAWHLNRWLITSPLYFADRYLDPSGLFAMGYTAVARKLPGPASDALRG